jgi:hypothetical protein
MTSLEITLQRNDKECQRRSSLPMRFLGFEGCALLRKPVRTGPTTEEVKHAKRSY